MSDNDDSNEIVHRLKHGRIMRMSHEQIRKCPFLIMTPEHYRDDGSCRCNEREHAVMVEWGYTWDDKLQHWMGDDDAT